MSQITVESFHKIADTDNEEPFIFRIQFLYIISAGVFQI